MLLLTPSTGVEKNRWASVEYFNLDHVLHVCHGARERQALKSVKSLVP